MHLSLFIHTEFYIFYYTANKLHLTISVLAIKKKSVINFLKLVPQLFKPYLLNLKKEIIRYDA